MDSDPTPGDPEEVRELADELQTFSDDVAEALGKIRGLASDRAMQDWAGLSAEAFRSEFDGVPGNLEKLRDSYDLCAQALQTYWPKLQTAQGQADRALDRAIAAQADLTAAQGSLGSAQDWVGRAGDEAERLQREGERADAPAPDEAEVRAATRDRQAANDARDAAQARVDTAQDSLDAARELARQAKEMREEAARQAARDIDEASDAGIQNRKWWQKAVHWVTENWDTIVDICKIVVAVLGVVVMIIGGPLAWVVLAAALIVLADTLIDYANGRASLWDVAFAALDCIPGMKGLTTLGGLARGLRGGLTAARTGLRGLAQGIRGLGPRMRNLGRDIRCLITRGDPIDLATGQMVMSATDVELPGVLPLVLERHHRTGSRSGQWLGPSWSSTLDQRLVLSEHGVRLCAHDGMVLDYPRPLADTPVLPVEGPAWPLAWDGEPGGELRVHRTDNAQTLRFRPCAGRAPTDLPLTAISDRKGNTISVLHDDEGAPAELTHHGGHRIALTRTGSRITALTLLSHPERPTLVRYGYDATGRLTEVVNSSGTPLRLSYDARHRLTGWEDRNGVAYRFTYDDADRCVAGAGADGTLAYTFTYDTDGASGTRITTVTDSLGNRTVHRFDDCLQLVAETDPLGHTVRQEWDRRDRLVSRTDASGQTLRLTYDDAGRPTAVHHPDGSVSTTRYDEAGNPVESTAPDGTAWRQEWDERGNCISVTDPTGAVTAFEHDSTGALTRLVDPTGVEQRFTNDALGHPVTATDPLGHLTRFTYDAFGNPATATDPLGGTTRWTWTPEGLLTSRTTPDGSGEHWTYDGEGNRLTHTDALGRVTRWTWTGFDQPASRTTPDGTCHTFAYDTELRLVRVTDPQGRTWDYAYDGAGRLISETDFDGRTVTYGYDPVGRLLSRTNPLGQSVEFSYDALGRQISKSVDGAVTRYTHDALGRLLRAESPDVTLTLTYDAAGRALTEDIDGRTLTRAYDVLGRTVARRTPSGLTTRYAYDAAGRRTALTTAGRTVTSAHDPLGRETRRGIGGAGLVLTQRWSAGQRLTGMALAVPGGEQPLAERSFTYRDDGRPAGVDDRAHGPRHYDRDAGGRVTAVRAADWDETYAYDGLGRPVDAAWPDEHSGGTARGTRTYDGSRVTRAGAVRYEYDAAGRVVLRQRKRLSRGPETWRYTWDAENRLTSVTTPDGTRWRYLHDPMGRRTSKLRLDSDGVTVLSRTDFTWDGLHLAEATDSAPDGAAERRTLTWERDGVRPLTQTERTVSARPSGQDAVDARFFAIVTDLIGTPTELVGEDGVVAWHGRATVWGLTTSDATATTDTPLRSPGQYHDPETGLHYNYFRHYDPLSARYLSPDPLGADAGPDAYAYVTDPLAWFDYLGLLTCRQHADILRANLRLDGRPVPANGAAAHLVPSGMTRNNGPAMRNLLARYNVDIDEAANGIPLGHPRPHNFTHRGPFLDRLHAHLDNFERNQLALGRSTAEIGDMLRIELRRVGDQVQSELRRLTLDQLISGTPHPSAYWTA
ncbi:DUF6531 domain-containing protein [Streptomyces sp. NPDC049881]|uniref:DUF6531 domain-containing protein n=1 Tax=Streptomyces sp. NPDC049881 TaxID=3155778 RepID=UPI00342BAE2C